jgi:hypothetical protein
MLAKGLVGLPRLSVIPDHVHDWLHERCLLIAKIASRRNVLYAETLSGVCRTAAKCVQVVYLVMQSRANS